MSNELIWRPNPVLLAMGEGQDPVDILEYLGDATDEYGALKRSRQPLRLPIDLYSPFWKDRSAVEDAVIKAAAAANVTLISASSDGKGKQQKTTASHGKVTLTSILRCDEGDCYRKKATNDVQRKLHCAPTYGETAKKDGVKLNKCTKQARRAPKRSYSSKPTKNATCQFCIRLSLVPGDDTFDYKHSIDFQFLETDVQLTQDDSDDDIAAEPIQSSNLFLTTLHYCHWRVAKTEMTEYYNAFKTISKEFGVSLCINTLQWGKMIKEHSVNGNNRVPEMEHQALFVGPLAGTDTEKNCLDTTFGHLRIGSNRLHLHHH